MGVLTLHGLCPGGGWVGVWVVTPHKIRWRCSALLGGELHKYQPPQYLTYESLSIYSTGCGEKPFNGLGPFHVIQIECAYVK